ncbi:MAG: hypothetical protein PVG53_13775, partial [Holophagae bacterium]
IDASPLRVPIRAVLAATALMVCVSGTASAQSPTWREVDNPYQEDIVYQLGETYFPQVDVEGVRWQSLAIDVGDGGLIAAEQDVAVEVSVEVENRTASSERVLIILLLEDADGGPLDRIEMKPFKVGGERRKERRESTRLASEDLRATERVYLFFEVLE